jgi:DNA invertase Pin-like site-specific DNA recombinase
MPERHVAFYARVSSESQARDNTIASQVAALRERIAADGGQLVDRLPRSGGVGSEHHAAARMSIPSMPARASAGVR